MAEPGNKNPAIDPAEGESQEVGERMSSLETQLAQFTILVSSLVENQRELVSSSVEQRGVKVESSGFVAAAPGGGGPETRTGGDAQGLGVSSMWVGSSSLAGSGLNPNVYQRPGRILLMLPAGLLGVRVAPCLLYTSPSPRD